MTIKASFHNEIFLLKHHNTKPTRKIVMCRNRTQQPKLHGKIKFKRFCRGHVTKSLFHTVVAMVVINIPGILKAADTKSPFICCSWCVPLGKHPAHFGFVLLTSPPQKKYPEKIMYFPVYISPISTF